MPTSRVSILQDGHVFGRDRAADTVLEGEEVSRQHAVASRQGLVYALTDLESRNGLFVNGVREKERALGPGDVVRIGEWVGLAVELDMEQPVRHELVELTDGWYGGPALGAVAESVRRVADTLLPVVVQGETGAGKEGVALAVHRFSGRDGPFVAVDCGALSEQLAEGQLFGYKKGAFTGATQQHGGFFREASGGTLFLDEILNLPLSLQVKLLRAIETREIIPLGASRPVPVDVRIVCAAQEPLDEAVTAGRFRADLRGRLEGLVVLVPPLRERREDILPLFERLVAPQTTEVRMEPRFAEALLLYDWPLNVRELVQLARRAVALQGDAEPLRRSMLPTAMRNATDHRSTPPKAKRSSTHDRDAFEALERAIREHGGNVLQAAEAIGISRSRANRLLAAHPEFDRKHAIQKERG
jgi:transcriptional regulator with PAS, ATPase and Fis domain